jgi:hypothetical protein
MLLIRGFAGFLFLAFTNLVLAEPNHIHAYPLTLYVLNNLAHLLILQILMRAAHKCVFIWQIVSRSGCY